MYKPNKDELLKKFIDKIVSEYEKTKDERKDLGARLYRNKELVSSAYKVMVSFKYHKVISEDGYDIKNVKRIINYYEVSGVISNKDELLLINEIELHNIRINARKKYDSYGEDLYNELPNILSLGYQQHDEIVIDLERKTTIDNLSKELRNTIDYIDTDEIVSTIELYRKYNLDNNEYKYLIIKIMNEYLEEIITLYELILEKSTYTNRRDRVEIIKDYYYVLDKYLILNKYYNDLCNEEVEEYFEEEIDDEVELEQQNQLIYAHSEVNVSKSRLIADMSDIPYEYYSTVYDLLDGFKNGKLSKKEIKTLSNSRKIKGHIELRYDQVRIILKHVKDNIYCVLGVFVKKSDNDRSSYKSIAERNLPNIKTEQDIESQLALSEYVEKELKNLVNTESRKGTR
jgi:hypothetical protein